MAKDGTVQPLAVAAIDMAYREAVEEMRMGIINGIAAEAQVAIDPPSPAWSRFCMDRGRCYHPIPFRGGPLDGQWRQHWMSTDRGLRREFQVGVCDEPLRLRVDASDPVPLPVFCKIATYRLLECCQEGKGYCYAYVYEEPPKPELPPPSWAVWKDGTVVQLARSIRGNRDWAALPILADALEESGCDHRRLPDWLRHAREGYHYVPSEVLAAAGEPGDSPGR